MSKARGRIENDSDFDMRECVGRAIESLVAYRCEGETPESVDVVGVLFHGAPYWHRFFLDAGIGFWEEWPAAQVFSDFDDCQRLDMTRRWPISGARVIDAVCESGSDSFSRFRWTLDRGQLSLGYRDETDEESGTVLLFEGKAEQAS